MKNEKILLCAREMLVKHRLRRKPVRSFVFREINPKIREINYSPCFFGRFLKFNEKSEKLTSQMREITPCDSS